MHDILDDISEQKDDVKTKWFPIFGFSFVYAFYTKIKWLVFDEIWSLMPKGILELVLFFFLVFLIIIELCICILLLRRKYLSNNGGDTFFTSLIFLMIAYLIFFLFPYDFSTGALPHFDSIVSSTLMVFFVSVPVSLIVTVLIKYVTANYLKRE